ncbi:hypothetical protein ACFL1X_14060 [Candidatus Hydrogenedentota bacterium]
MRKIADHQLTLSFQPIKARNSRKWRAGIEGAISAAKRAYGLSRCNWSSFESFNAYVHLGVLAFNLTMLAKLL